MSPLVAQAVIRGDTAAVARSTFATAFTRLERLVGENVAVTRDTAVTHRRFRAIERALDDAALAATSGDEFLALATISSAQYFATERTVRLAEEASRRAPLRADSARVLMVGAWDLDVIASENLATAELERRLGVVDTLLLRRPANASAHTFRAELLFLLERDTDALAAARQGVVLAPEDSIGWNWTIYHRIAASSSPDADDAVFARMIAGKRADARDWAEHGKHLGVRGQWAGAGEAYLNAFRTAGDPTPSHACEAGRYYWAASVFDSALAAMRACIDAYARNRRVDTADLVLAHRAIASILNDRGGYAQAESHARHARALDPSDAWAALELSRALLKQDHPAEASVAAQEALALSDGRFKAMHVAAGTAYFALKEWAKCTRAFKQASEMSDSDDASAYNAALCTSADGDNREAARWLSIALQRNPKRSDRATLEELIRNWSK